MLQKKAIWEFGGHIFKHRPSAERSFRKRKQHSPQNVWCFPGRLKILPPNFTRYFTSEISNFKSNITKRIHRHGNPKNVCSYFSLCLWGGGGGGVANPQSQTIPAPHFNLNFTSCLLLLYLDCTRRQKFIEYRTGWSLEMPSSKPQPQYWIHFLDPLVHAFDPALGWGFA